MNAASWVAVIVAAWLVGGALVLTFGRGCTINRRAEEHARGIVEGVTPGTEGAPVDGWDYRTYGRDGVVEVTR